MFDELKPDDMKRYRLETVYVQRPHCVACNSVNVVKYRSVDQGDGSRLAYMRCREPNCGQRFRVVME